jgi:RHS repeat-associated protein
MKMTDESGAVVWSADYRPFGELSVSNATVENKFRFPGQYYDSETGLHYNYHRYYQPKIARYVSPDPIGFKGGLNLYRYVFNNPINFMDPSGLECLVCNRKATGIIGMAGGNHAYIWDTTANNGQGDGYGMQGSFGYGVHTQEKGPADDACAVVKGSAGKEKEIMDYLKKNADNWMWTPFINDCHNAAKDAVESQQLKYPGAPGGRYGDIP